MTPKITYNFTNKCLSGFIRYFVWFLIIVCAPDLLSGQTLNIREITISGLHKTREYLVRRELTIHKGSSIRMPDLMQTLEDNEHRILNTGLFTSTEIEIKNLDLDSAFVDLSINLTESWYIYPAPLLEFLDNDINKWLYNYKLSLSKISYGLFLKHINLTGNADALTVYAQGGFTRKYSIDYYFPYLNKDETLGAGILFFHSQNRDLAYFNYENKLRFYHDENKELLSRTKFGFSLTYKPRLYWKYSLQNYGYWMRADQSVLQLLNPDFIPSNKQFIHEITAAAEYDSRNIAPYPTAGQYFNLWLSRTGNLVNDKINLLQTGIYAGVYSPINSQWSLSNTVSAVYNIDRGKTPYFFTKSLGYGDESLRGYENYVMNGQDFAYTRNSVRLLLWNSSFLLNNFMPFKAYRTLPVRIYLTSNVDLGYVRDRFYFTDNSYVNRLLIGGGLGLDFVFYYNKLIRIEYSINHTGEKGLYLHFNAGL